MTPTHSETERANDLRNKQRPSFYFPEPMLEEIRQEAARLNRSVSWVVRRAWRAARIAVHRMPGGPSDS
jgi:uncharacterized small protein (TIGR04563 family)